MANSAGPVLLSGEKTVATAGTAEALLGASQRVKSVVIIAKKGNTNQVYLGGPDVAATALCGAMEMELSRLEPADEQEMREGLDAGESGLDRMARLSYEVLGLLTFFTGNSKDVRAWTIARGTAALKAAGKVHSDFERGFIRAEAIGVADLEECGSLAEARRRGALRHEGKGYVVQDGDVLNILFNV